MPVRSRSGTPRPAERDGVIDTLPVHVAVAAVGLSVASPEEAALNLG
jgi:hypothetical protein